MIHGDAKDAGRRAYLGISRGTLVKADDATKMQELTIRDRFGEQKTNVEHWQPDGFSHVPIPPADGHEAEVLVAYLGGSPDHPVVIATADRRHRPKNMRPGEKAFFDDQGQTIHIGRDRVTVTSSKGLRLSVGGATVDIDGSGNITMTPASGGKLMMG